MTRNVDTVIIGAGTAGLSALREIEKQTDNYVIVDHGPLGTTCARIGCMPSKALIQVANDYHRRQIFAQEGIEGADSLSCNIPAALRHVRNLRDRFTGGVVDAMRKRAADHLIEGTATIESPECVSVDGCRFHTKTIIIATGAHPIIPSAWQRFSDRILTCNNIFEQTDLPGRIGVVGLGPIGIELGQAISRLGIDVAGFDLKAPAGLTDPDVAVALQAIIEGEFPLYIGESATLNETDNALRIEAGKNGFEADAVILAMGMRPNIDDLGLENLGVELDEHGLPPIDQQTMQVSDLPVYMAGDMNNIRPILHEAADEGLISGRNAMRQHNCSYVRRTLLRVVFSEPQAAVVGQSFSELEQGRFVVGKLDYQGQGRARIEAHDHGLLHVYAEKKSGRILGAEMAAPEAEHLAHTLVLAIQHGLTVPEVLQAPFYHPTIEEGLQRALQHAAGKLGDQVETRELQLCDSCPETPLR